MKALISMLAVALALVFAGPAFAQDVKTAKTCRRLCQGRWGMGCRHQHLRREKDVAVALIVAASIGRRLRSAPFSLFPTGEARWD